MRLHLVALPHTQTTADYLTCAYTQKVVKFCRMMTEHTEHEVWLYSGEQNEALATEHITCVLEEERAGWFGDGFDTVQTPLEWDAHAPYFKTMNERVIYALSNFGDFTRDLLLLTTGWPQQPIANALPAMTACEYGVGYEGISTKYVAFESHAWRHHVYGLQGWRQGRYYDATIPNYFDLDDFLKPRRRKPGDYLLYLGRVIERKGVHIAAMIAERLGMPLIVAGPGVTEHEPGVGLKGDGVVIEGDVYYAGEVGREERAALLEGADALLAPTVYIEPFGGVAVEAMLSGTPVIGPDYGAFTETIREGVSGYRFATLAEAVEGARRARALRPREVRAYAASRYSLEAVAPLYDRWFRQLDGLWGVGWDA